MTEDNHKAQEAQYLKDTALEKIVEQLMMFDQRLISMETGTTTVNRRSTNTVETLSKDVKNLRSELTHVNNRAATMRLDRQFKLAAQRIFSKETTKEKKTKLTEVQKDRKRTAKKVTRSMKVKTKVGIICGAYPGGQRNYGGEFIQKRAEAYQAAGLAPVVIEVSAATKTLMRHKVQGVEVVRLNLADLGELLHLSTIRKFALHSVEKPVWKTVKPYIDKTPAFVWVHGFEARRWQELAFNFSQEDLETLRPRLDKANEDRMETMRAVFNHPNVQTIFVSHYMKVVAEGFAGVQASRSHVIHNSINPKDFPYTPKTPEARKHILWVRTFAAKNYANDISRDVILGLSTKPYFKELSFSIFGAGRYFDEITAPLRDFENVSIDNRFLNRQELQEQHNQHGVKLVPSRWDSQGLTCGEAMHSGLVPLTSFVTGLKEFVDEDCAILAPHDGVQELIDGYDRMLRDPVYYMELSANAATRSSKQCQPQVTLEREITLLKA